MRGASRLLPLSLILAAEADTRTLSTGVFGQLFNQLATSGLHFPHTLLISHSSYALEIFGFGVINVPKF